MFNHSYISEIGLKTAIDITGNRYSDSGMMWNELSIKTGIPRSIIERYDDWYILNNEFYFLKDRCIIEELFMSELANECKVKCVQFLLASCDDNIGIMSKLYRDKDKEYYMYSDFCNKYFGDIPKSLEMFKLSSLTKFGFEKTEQFMKDIFDLICLDILSGQWDREEYNFFFECTNENDVRIAPLCDNGSIFRKSFFYSFPFGEFSLDEDRIYKGNLPYILSCEKYFYNKLVLMLDINVDDILNKTSCKYNINIDNNDRKRILSYFDNRKKMVDTTLKLVR